MDGIRREVEERRDADAEKLMELKIRELQDSASGKLDEAINHSEQQHLRNLMKIETEQQGFMDKVEEMKEEDQQNHEARKAELLAKNEAKLANISKKCDVVTQAALNNLEETKLKMTAEAKTLEEENKKDTAKIAEIEVDVGRRMFDEVDAQKDKDEYLSEKRSEELMKQHSSIQSEEQKIVAAERAERKKNAGLAISEMRNDLVEHQKVGLFNLAIQHNADDRKNRKQINAKIREVKNYAQDLDQCYGRAYVVLGADAEMFKLVTPSRKRATKGHLARFNEILDSINKKLCDIEQNLASLELQDVEMSKISRQIKSQISSFGRVIANLKLTLELEGVALDPKKTEEFSMAKDILFEQINDMEVISEKREAIVHAIQERQEETMPTIETLAIEN